MRTDWPCSPSFFSVCSSPHDIIPCLPRLTIVFHLFLLALLPLSGARYSPFSRLPACSSPSSRLITGSPCRGVPYPAFKNSCMLRSYSLLYAKDVSCVQCAVLLRRVLLNVYQCAFKPHTRVLLRVFPVVRPRCVCFFSSQPRVRVHLQRISCCTGRRAASRRDDVSFVGSNISAAQHPCRV